MASHTAPESRPLLLLGASVRAAAFSALRARLWPWCADLFADEDLRARCPVVQIAQGGGWPQLKRVLQGAPGGPWAYTGRYEDRTRIVKRISQERPLWGNGPETLRRARSPFFVESILKAAGCARARVWLEPPSERMPCLVKPRRSTLGRPRFWNGRDGPQAGWFLQEWIEGRPAAAVYVGDSEHAEFLGLTRQLAGEPWLSGPPFCYCGSVGPLPLRADLRESLTKLGNVLTKGCGLRGVFGVDLVLRGDEPVPVEVNPRYVASAEVLEHALGRPVMGLHQRVFDRAAPAPSAFASPSTDVLGKAIVFARAATVFPASGPWSDNLPREIAAFPLFADIPRPSQRIERGAPIMTVFARGQTEADCLRGLQRAAAALDRCLWPR